MRIREWVGATLYPLNCLPTAFTPTVLEPVCLFDVPRCRPFPATRSNRSSVSGYLRTKRTRAAAWGFGLARPCSHFSRVRSLIRSLRAKTAREHRSLLGVSRINLESTLGSGATFPGHNRLARGSEGFRPDRKYFPRTKALPKPPAQPSCITGRNTSD